VETWRCAASNAAETGSGSRAARVRTAFAPHNSVTRCPGGSPDGVIVRGTEARICRPMKNGLARLATPVATGRSGLSEWVEGACVMVYEYAHTWNRFRVALLKRPS
jgi:hypothetical protein